MSKAAWILVNLTLFSHCISALKTHHSSAFRYSAYLKFNKVDDSLPEGKMIDPKLIRTKAIELTPTKINAKKSDLTQNDFETESESMDNKPAATSTSNLSLTFSQLKPFLMIATPFFKDDKTARLSLIAVISLTLLNSAVSVSFSYITRDFYTALNLRDESLFFEKVGTAQIALPRTEPKIFHP